MAGPSDHELISEIQSGRREALGVLFDRYSPQLYEFIYLITGDRDQAAQLLGEVFLRVPTAIAGLAEHELVPGWLYGLAREASLTYLRQKDWLDALPPSDEPTVSGLPGDIWRAARAMPAFHRAVLVVEELHGLSPTEKARTLNVSRTDIPRLVEEARRSFNQQFDLQARQQGRPLSTQVDPERIWGIHRRLGTDGSLFGYLPTVVLPESLATALRTRILSSVRVEPADENPVIITQETETTEQVVLEQVPVLPPPPTSILPEGCSAPVIATALLIALVITSVAACVGYFFVRDTASPTITKIDPPDKAFVPPTANAALTHVIVAASYTDDRAVDVKSVLLVIDGRNVTDQALISDSNLTYPTDLDPGTHTLLLQLRDTSGNKASRAWQFTILPTAEATATPSATPTITPTAGPSVTPTATATGTLPLPPVVSAFTANQTTVRAGTSVLLTWAVSNADVVFLNQDKVDPTGSRLVTPTATTAYHLIANNTGGTTDRMITITVQSLPDLTVTDVSVSPTGQVTYTIRNSGVGDVTQMFLIQVLVDGLIVDSHRRVSSLPAGQEVSLFVPNYILTGLHVVTVRVNGDQQLQEASTTNNELTRTLSGPAPTPTNTFTPTNVPTSTPTSTATNIPTNTPTSTATSTPTATATIVATGISATLTSTSPYTGTCPGNAFYSGVITTTAPVIVRYQWERSDGIVNGPFNVPAGTTPLTVADQWLSAPLGTSWERVHVLQPNDLASNQVVFTNNCH